MNYIFFILIAVSIIIGIFNNTISEVVNSMLQACDIAVKISFSLIGIMAFWLGIMRIAEKSGLVKMLSRLLEPIAKILFKDVKKDSPAIGDISMSVAANALGLTNAATPIGLKVMKELQEGIKVGAKILFAGGIYGKIVRIKNDVIDVEINKSTVIQISRYSIQDVITD